MEQGAEPVLQWGGVGGGPGCAAFAHVLPSSATGCRQQQVFPCFFLASFLLSLSQKIRIIVTAGSEWEKKVERKNR